MQERRGSILGHLPGCGLPAVEGLIGEKKETLGFKAEIGQGSDQTLPEYWSNKMSKGVNRLNNRVQAEPGVRFSEWRKG